MAENQNELQIVLELVDKASAQVKKAMAEVKKETDFVGKSSEEASETMNEGFKKAGRELKDFRQAMFGVTAVIGTIIVTTKEWAKYNLETKAAYDSLGDNIKKVSGLIGSMFAPTITALSNLLKASMVYIERFFELLQERFIELFRNFQYVVQFIVAFTSAMVAGANIVDAFSIATRQAKETVSDLIDELRKSYEQDIPQLDAQKRKLQEFNEQLNKVKLEYIAGSISAQDYYAKTKGLMDDEIIKRQECSAIMLQQIEISRLAMQQDVARNEATSQALNSQRAFYQEVALLQNQDLLNQKINADAATNLLKTVQSMQVTLWGSIFNFMNTGIKAFHANFSTALASIIMGTKSAKEAFKEFGKKMIESVVNFVAQLAVQALISLTIGKLIQASVSATASSLAAAWLPAAVFASVATLGAADAAGAAGLAAASASGVALMTAMQSAGSATSGATDVIRVTKSASEMGSAVGEGIGYGGAQAQGGEGIVTRPTVFLAGEAGPEYYNFTPMSKVGRLNGGNNINIEVKIDGPVVRSELDIQRLTEEVSRGIAREIERL